MIIDPDEVAATGKERAAAHWAVFARLSPRLQAGDEVLAARLDGILAEVSAQIDCTACGRCCRQMGPPLDEADLIRLETGLNLDRATMQSRLLRPMWPGAAADDQVWLLPDPCPLHDGRLCTVYEHRPQVCRDFPQAVGANPVERLQVWVEYARICPITFNTIERIALDNGR